MNETGHINNIRVPKQYAHELKKKKTRGESVSPEYREALVRDYVKANKGKIMKMSDFSRVAYDSSTQGIAHPLIKKLKREGKLIRIKTHKPKGQRGVAYTYLWRDDLPSSSKEKEYKNGPVNIITPANPKKLPSFKTNLNELIDDYLLSIRIKTDDHEKDIVYGLHRFKLWINSNEEEK